MLAILFFILFGFSEARSDESVEMCDVIANKAKLLDVIDFGMSDAATRDLFAEIMFHNSGELEVNLSDR